MRNALVVPFVLVVAACGSSTPGTPAANPTPAAEAKAANTQAEGPPVAEVRPVKNTYHGVDVVDSYQWLERDDDPQVKAWANGQNAHARATLDALPNLAAVREQVTTLWTEPVPGYGGWQVRGKRLFATAWLPPREQAVLVEFADATSFGGQRIVLDPATLSDDVTLSFDYVKVSPDGTKVAVSMSRKGSEAGDLAVFDTATGARLPDAIPGVNYGTAAGDLTWLADSSGFFYARYPRPDERPAADLPFYQTLWFHALGSPVADDRLELGPELTRLAQIHTELRKETGELLATVQNGDSGGVAHWLRSPKGRWTQLSTYDDQIEQVVFGNPGELFAISFAGTPRGKVVRLTNGALDFTKARVVVAEGSDAINYSFWYDAGIVVTPKRLYVSYQLGGPVALRAFDHAGKRLSDPPQLEIASIGDPKLIRGEEIIYYQAGYLEPPAWYRYDAASNKGARIDAVSERSSVDFSDAVVRREVATSADGTKVPLNIVMRADHPLDGSRPCIATGYGGYGLSETPSFRKSLRVSLDRGVCFAYSNLRGGGEFGEEWHRQGMLTKKQNVFDDFAAVLKLLVSRGYTSAERLGIIGGSNGGLLMGAMLTQHPELFRAVVSSVGIYDSLRTELEANGEFNIPEFGTVKDEAQFRALHAYSPYHRVEPGTRYPAVLLSHGDNDPRVAPWQSRKMAAALQAANVSDQPILLMTSASAGHGAGSLTESIDLYSRRLAFLLHHIGAAEPTASR